MKSKVNTRGFMAQPSRALGCKCITIASLVIINAITYLALDSLSHLPAHESRPDNLLRAATLDIPNSSSKLKYWIYRGLQSSTDESPRCLHAGICDGQAHVGQCGTDGLGCMTAAVMRQEAIKQAMKGSWDAYRNLSHRDWQHQGITIIDAMSTLLLMNMTEEYKAAHDWAVQPDRSITLGQASVFETNIRVVGGLLSAYTLNGSSDNALLAKAQQVADSLLPSFDVAGGIPHSYYSPGRTNLAEAGTYSLEMTTLSYLTGNMTYANASKRLWRKLDDLDSCDGIYCTWFDPSSMRCLDHSYGFGASADSMYEYMLKQWVLSSKLDQGMLMRYRLAMAGMRKHLIRKVKPCKQVWPKGAQNKGLVDQAAAASISRGSSGSRSFVQAHSLHKGVHARSWPAHHSAWHDMFWIAAEATQSGQCTAVKLYSWAKADPVLPPSRPQGMPAAATSRRTTTRKQLRLPSMEDGIKSAGSTQNVGSTSADAHEHNLHSQLLQSLDSQGHVSKPTAGMTVGSQAVNEYDIELDDTAAPAITPQLRLQHLSCFLPGMLALGHMHGVNTATRHASVAALVRNHVYPGHPIQARSDDDLLLAAKLMRSCYELYRNSNTGVAGDDVYWQEDNEAGAACHKLQYRSTDSFLRPEVVESLFYLWRATKDPVYQDWGWQIFRSHYKFSRLPSGAYATLMGATTAQHRHGDRQESFWLAETLKYLYLLFSDDPALLPLDKWVLNTEAHPLPVWDVRSMEPQ